MPTLTTLVNFDGSNGANPEAGLIADAAGNLYGITYGGGTDDDGTVFEIPYSAGSYASTPTTLFSFDGTNGAHPDIGLSADTAGDLFGTTDFGGANGLGTVFELPYTNGSYASTPTTLFDFSASHSYANLIVDAAGNLFGTTVRGGATGGGAIFEIPYVVGSYASTPTTVASFNGECPFGGLVADASGDLFGTTNFGGTNNDGTVFELRYIDGSYAGAPTTLASFDNTNGLYPSTSLILDANGDLFGTRPSQTWGC